MPVADLTVAYGKMGKAIQETSTMTKFVEAIHKKHTRPAAGQEAGRKLSAEEVAELTAMLQQIGMQAYSGALQQQHATVEWLGSLAGDALVAMATVTKIPMRDMLSIIEAAKACPAEESGAAAVDGDDDGVAAEGGAVDVNGGGNA